MRPWTRHRTALVVAALLACAQEKDASEAQPGQPAPRQVPAEDSHPLASLQRMVGGEWQMKASRSSLEVTQFDVWAWGPGEHSMRVQTDGSGGEGEPWRELEVFYWHPGRKQICVLGLVPHGWGVSEGTMRLGAEVWEAALDLYQHGNRRVLGVRWTFGGPDHLHEALLEGGTLLAEWDWFHAERATSKSKHPLPEVPELTESLRVLAPLLGHSWLAEGALPTGEAFLTRTTVEWVPHATAVEARVFGPIDEDGAAPELLDVYFYDHTGREGLRCLALSAWGAVYEGDVIVLEDGALEIEMTGYHRDEVVSHMVRFDFERDGALRDRVWSLHGAERTLLFDLRHEKQDPNGGG